MPGGFSFTILLTLMAMLIASMTVYVILVHRFTTQRRWLALVEWASEHGLRASSESGDDIPEVLSALGHSTIGLCVRDKSVAIMQLHAGESRWHVLVKSIGSDWNSAALRPTSAGASVIDAMNLSTLYSASTPRFNVVGAEARAAGALARSPAVALLPPDVGLLVSGRSLVLDFSTRPFDPIELDRMLDVAEQIGRSL